MNLNTNNIVLSVTDYDKTNFNSNLLSGLVLVNENSSLEIPKAPWKITLFTLTGAQVISKKITNSTLIKWSELAPNINNSILIYRLEKI